VSVPCRNVHCTGGAYGGSFLDDQFHPSCSFPNDVFEPAILSLLKELNPKDMLVEETAGESTSLAASLVRVEESIASIVSEMDEHGESPILF
jgi:hypothetical protein